MEEAVRDDEHISELYEEIDNASVCQKFYQRREQVDLYCLFSYAFIFAWCVYKLHVATSASIYNKPELFYVSEFW